MDVGKILFAKDWSQKAATKIIRKGNQHVRTKTVVTPMGQAVARLKDGVMTVDGGKVEVLDVRGSMSKKDAIKVMFENFERLFDPKYDAWPDIKKALS